MAGHTGSLRSRLLLSGLAGIVLAAVAVAAILGAAFERTLLGTFDRRLTDDLLTVAGAVTADGGGQARMRDEPLDTRYGRVFSGHYWVVTSGNREFRSRSLWDASLPAMDPATNGAPTDPGGTRFANVPGPLGQTVRIASRSIRLPGVDEPVRIRVASDVSETLAEIAGFRVLAGVAGAIVAGALLLVLVLQASYGLRPLREITQALGALRSGKAREVDAARFPREIRPLAEELNAVLVHHQRMIERARTGAGDLAHAMKTPLSVMLAAAERDDVGLARVVEEQVQRIRLDVDRHLAISTPADRQARTPIAAVVQSLVRMLSSVYADHGQGGVTFHYDVGHDLEFHGDRADLEDMLGNLVDNAGKWARSRVDVSAAMEDGQISIAVSDDGPGIPAEDMDAAIGRGTRLDEQTPGSGLGLSIAAALAQSYGGALSLRAAEPHGLVAVLVLPGAHSLP